MSAREVTIKDTHRGLRYVDGVFDKVLEAGRHEIPRHWNSWFHRTPRVEIVLVDMRERELTIKGQEILSADKVALRVSIVVQFRVRDPKAALHVVESYEERLYSDVQLAARRSLAQMTLEEILTNRNRLSEDILRDVQEAAGSYGVSIHRADVQRIEAQVRGEAQQKEAQAGLEAQRLRAEGEADALRVRTEAAARALEEQARTAQAYSEHPALLRLRELEALQELARSANARIYIGFDKHARPGDSE